MVGIIRQSQLGVVVDSRCFVASAIKHNFLYCVDMKHKKLALYGFLEICSFQKARHANSLLAFTFFMCGEVHRSKHRTKGNMEVTLRSVD